MSLATAFSVIEALPKTAVPVKTACFHSAGRPRSPEEGFAPSSFRVLFAVAVGAAMRRCRPRRLKGHITTFALAAGKEIFNVGVKVKVVADDISFFHSPAHKGKAYNPKGLTGKVVYVEQDEHVTPNRPILVNLTEEEARPATAEAKKFQAFKAHFTVEELEICSDMPRATEDTTVTTSADGSSVGKAASASNVLQASDTWQINLLYDGQCSTCMRQVEFLEKRMDEAPEYAGLVKFTDLHAPDYDSKICGGVEFEDGMRHLHAVTRDGKVVVGPAAIRSIYSLVGMEWVYTVTTLPVVGSLFDWVLDLWSEYRLRAMGRSDILDRVHKHQQNIKELSTEKCEAECEVDWSQMDNAMPIIRQAM